MDGKKRIWAALVGERKSEQVYDEVATAEFDYDSHKWTLTTTTHEVMYSVK